MTVPVFQKARPVWLKGLSRTMNISAGFRSVFRARKGRHILRITGATLYRIWLNGKFIGHGPARCGHGFYRVDEWCLPVEPGKNLIAIEVAGYNVNGYYILDQPSFVQAEVVCGDQVLAATGSKKITALRLKERVQKVQRYSFQRPFVEVYRMNARSDAWRTELKCRKKPQAIEVLEKKRLVSRGVPYPQFETRQPVERVSTGTVSLVSPRTFADNRAWSQISPVFKGFQMDKLDLILSREMESLKSRVRSRKSIPYSPQEPLILKKGTFQVLDLGTNLTGFIGLTVSCKKPVTLYLGFDELLQKNGDIDFLRLDCLSAIKYELKPGTNNLESIEPYTLRYLKLIAARGSCKVSHVFLREYACSDTERASFVSNDPQLDTLFEAARQTFRQNAVDILMDCPSRERAGWLCDSFFTARAERELSGGSPIERNFLENYLLPGTFPNLPKGMLPMCYPAEHTTGRFIPNWAMWFVVELEEYLQRTGNRELVTDLQKKVYDLIEYFKGFLNSDGLLEKLDSWVFLEWSQANHFTQDVNYPSNMLYAGMLDAAGRIYSDSKLLRQAAAIRRKIQKQSFDGEFFVDNAVRDEKGTLKPTANRSETCQYYAFFFDVASPKTHPALWKKLITEFGPDRNPKKEHPDIHSSNAFIGFILRLDVLSRYGEAALVLDQLKKDYVPMAEKVGTLWEHDDTTASCNHGFAGSVAHILFRDVLGVRVDSVRKNVEFRIPSLALTWCSGRIPVGDDSIQASWRRQGKKISHTLAVPAGYTTEVTVCKGARK